METLTPEELCKSVIGDKCQLDKLAIAKLSSMGTVRERLLFLGQEFGHLVEPSPTARTPVIFLMRNAKVYLRWVFPHVYSAIYKALDGMNLPPPCFYVYENNSTDGTDALLRGFEGPNFVVCLDTCPMHMLPSGSLPRSTARCRPMADMRNASVVMALRHLLRSDLCLVADTSVWINSKSICGLIQGVTAQKLDIATPFTMLKDNHYYDTFALVHVDEISTNVRLRRDCFVDCKSCAKWRQDNHFAQRIPTVDMNRKDPLKVQSAFGGMACARSSVVRKMRWASTNDLCEHVAFGKGLNVGIVMDSQAWWHHDMTMINIKDLNKKCYNTDDDGKLQKKTWISLDKPLHNGTRKINHQHDNNTRPNLQDRTNRPTAAEKSNAKSRYARDQYTSTLQRPKARSYTQSTKILKGPLRFASSC